MAYLKVIKNFLESSKLLLSRRKLFLWLFQENFLFQADNILLGIFLVGKNICLGRFFVGNSGVSDGQVKYCLKEQIFNLF